MGGLQGPDDGQARGRGGLPHRLHGARGGRAEGRARGHRDPEAPHPRHQQRRRSAALGSRRDQGAVAKQVTAPVLWEDSVASMLENGFEKAMELGPGKVTAGVLKRIDRSAECSNVEVWGNYPRRIRNVVVASINERQRW